MAMFAIPAAVEGAMALAPEVMAGLSAAHKVIGKYAPLAKKSFGMLHSAFSGKHSASHFLSKLGGAAKFAVAHPGQAIDRGLKIAGKVGGVLGDVAQVADIAGVKGAASGARHMHNILEGYSGQVRRVRNKFF